MATVEEIVRNYNVDAIHLDDYFYPANYPLSAGEAIKAIDEDVSFGISPRGIKLVG